MCENCSLLQWQAIGRNLCETLSWRKWLQGSLFGGSLCSRCFCVFLKKWYFNLRLNLCDPELISGTCALCAQRSVCAELTKVWSTVAALFHIPSQDVAAIPNKLTSRRVCGLSGRFYIHVSLCLSDPSATSRGRETSLISTAQWQRASDQTFGKRGSNLTPIEREAWSLSLLCSCSRYTRSFHKKGFPSCREVYSFRQLR